MRHRLGRSRLLAGAAAGVVAAGGAGIAIAAALPLSGPPRTVAQFGYVKSLTKRGTGYELRLDPALWLEGATARRAAREDGTEAFDYYIRNPEKKLLTYRLAADARVTVVTVTNLPRSTRITVPELAAIVKGKNPKGRKLMDPGGHLGYWAKVRIDAVLSLDQQYQP